MLEEYLRWRLASGDPLGLVGSVGDGVVTKRGLIGERKGKDERLVWHRDRGLTYMMVPNQYHTPKTPCLVGYT